MITRGLRDRSFRWGWAAALAALFLLLPAVRPGAAAAPPETPQEEALADAAHRATPHPDLQGEEGVSCTDCHAEILEGEMKHAPAEAGECESCHAFEGSGEERTVSLSAPPVELCVMCHADQEAQIQMPSVHGAIAAFGCPGCHNPHSSPNARLLRKPPGNALCLECHAGNSGEHPADAAGNVLLFDDRPVGAARFDRIPKLRLREDRGHPVGGHPVAGERDPLRPDAPFGCSSCHAPHGSERRGLLTGGAGGSLCARCHRK